jgi:hypothetical protein
VAHSLGRSSAEFLSKTWCQKNEARNRKPHPPGIRDELIPVIKEEMPQTVAYE